MEKSKIYTVDMLDEMDKLEDSVNSEIKTFLEELNEINEQINILSDKLNEDGVEKLNLNGEIENIVSLIIKQHNKYSSLTMSDDEKEKVIEGFDKVKENCVALLNKHINRYNSQVDYINARINEMTTKLENVELNDEIREMIEKLEVVSRCETFNNGDWRQISYLDTLDYAKLSEQVNNISFIEKKLKIKPMESVEIWISCNHIEQYIAEIEKEVNDKMTLGEINKLINKCYVCYEQIIDTDIRYALFREGVSDKKRIAKNNSKLVKALEKLDSLEKQLKEKRKQVSGKTNSYKVLLYRLELLEKRYSIIVRKISEYKGKCNDTVIKRLNTSYLEKYEKKLVNIQERIELKKDIFDIIQYRNLNKKLKKLTSVRDGINFDLNISPMMLNGVDVGLDFENKLNEFDIKLNELKNKIDSLGDEKLRLVKDHNVRKDIDKTISARWNDIYAYEKLLGSYKKESPEIYKTLNKKLTEKKTKFDEISKSYRGKCPLMVKQVKSAKHLYKKHRKEALVIAGLSTMVLLLGNSVLIPAIMHGNIMISVKSAAMRPFIKTVNNVLGGMIGATKDINGGWFLANGTLINPSVASTSLLKGIAISGLGQTALFSPLIAGVVLGVKNLVGKMKSGELKKKLQDSKEKKQRQKAERIETRRTKKIDEILMNEINQLFMVYRDSGMTLEEFVSVNKLSVKQSMLLQNLEEQAEEMKKRR